MEEERQAGIEETVKEEVKEDIEAIKSALAEAKVKVEANLAGWQRAQADFVNYKRRCEQEKEETLKQASAALISSLLPILDDFERALEAIPAEAARQKWVEGIKLIQRKYKSTLEAQGVAEIKAQGEKFDPALHEAISEAKGKEGVVIQEVQKGYKLGDRVLRAAKVIVGNGEAGAKGAPEAEQEDTGEEN